MGKMTAAGTVISETASETIAATVKMTNGCSGSLPCQALRHVGRKADASVTTDAVIAAATGTTPGQMTDAASRTAPAPPTAAHHASSQPTSRSPCRHPATRTTRHPAEPAPASVAAGSCPATAAPAHAMPIDTAQIAQDTSRGCASRRMTSAMYCQFAATTKTVATTDPATWMTIQPVPERCPFRSAAPLVTTTDRLQDRKSVGAGIRG